MRSGWRLVLLPAIALLAGMHALQPGVTLHLAGDSTMAAKRAERRPETGWGEMLAGFFAAGSVRVVNHAMNGRSTRTFISEGRWQALVDSVAPGDYVFIQFGHNDGSVEKLDRYTPPEDYRRNLTTFVADVRAKEGIPVLFTPVRRRRLGGDGALVDTHGAYPDLVRTVAREQGVALVDMHESSAAVLRGRGVDGSRALFLQLKAGEHPNYPEGIEDNTHFSPAGACVMAALAVREVAVQAPALALRTRNDGGALSGSACQRVLPRSGKAKT